MARTSKKRRFVRGAVLIGAGGAVVGAIRKQIAGTEAPPTEVVRAEDSPGDPLVEEETRKAAAEAGAVGGSVQDMADSEPDFTTDPEMRPVEEAAGDTEPAEEVDSDLGGPEARP